MPDLLAATPYNPDLGRAVLDLPEELLRDALDERLRRDGYELTPPDPGRAPIEPELVIDPDRLLDLSGVELSHLMKIRTIGGKFEDGKIMAGQDDRREVEQAPGEIQDLHRSVALIVKTPDFDDSGTRLSLSTRSLYKRMLHATPSHDLCTNVSFRSQATVGYGTAFLVAPRWVATAKHNLYPLMSGGYKTFEHERVRFVFDHRLRSGRLRRYPRTEDVRGAAPQIVDNRVSSSGEDWALLELDEPVTDRPFLELSSAPAPPPGTPLFTLGHPLGLPGKYTPNGRVLAGGDAWSFLTELDTFRGNSGSPVFREGTTEVVGLLRKGRRDFERVPEKRCSVEVTLRLSEMRERVNVITNLRQRLQEILDA